jgi:hypothetical protein
MVAFLNLPPSPTPLAPPLPLVSGFTPNASIFRDQRRSLDVVSMCSGEVLSFISHLAVAGFTFQMISDVDIDPHSSPLCLDMQSTQTYPVGK